MRLMKKKNTQITVNRLSTAILAILLCNPSAASDIAFNAYLEFPLGGSSSPFFSFRAGPDATIYTGVSEDSAATQRMEFKLRYGAGRSPTFFINGVPVTRSLILNASGTGKSQTTENGFDWRLVGAAALGIGVIVAATQIDFGSTDLSACSGKDCPPKEESTSESKSTITIKTN